MTEKKICFRCKELLEFEKEKSIDYPYYCENCDENMYEFESEPYDLKKDIKDVIDYIDGFKKTDEIKLIIKRLQKI